MRNRVFSKRRLAIVAATVAIALAGGGAAFAYFTSTGTGTGTGTVATSTPFTVSVSTPTGGPISPGSPGETFTYSVMNNDTGTQDISGATITVAPDAAALGRGCDAAWYQVSGADIATTGNPATETYTAPISIAGGATSNDPQLTLTLSMTDTGTNQDACQGDAPVVTVTVS